MKKLFSKMSKFAPLTLFILASVLYSILAIVRHNNFQSFAFDLGIYDQAVWLYSRVLAPFSTVKMPNMLILADHFNPSLALLAPIYWIKDDVRMLLIAQALIFTTSGYPIYKLAKIYLKNSFCSLSILFAYYFFWGVQLALAFDFHEVTIVASLLSWLFYFAETKRWKIFFLILIICLGLKEDVSIILGSLGVFIILTYKNLKIGITTILISIAWFLIVTKIIMTESVIGQNFAYGVNFPKSITEVLGIFFSPLIPKWKTIFLSLLPFALLPIFAKGALFMIFTHFLVHFLDPRFYGRWEIALHYRAPLTAILAVGTIIALSKIKSEKRLKFLSLAIIIATLFLQVYLHAPLNILLKKPFYQKDGWMVDIEYLMKKIPALASVATQNNILPHLSHRKQIYYFLIEDKRFLDAPPPCGRPSCWWINSRDADYILVDLHSGQSLNNFWDKNEIQAKEAVESLIKVGDYNILETKGDAYLLVKSK